MTLVYRGARAAIRFSRRVQNFDVFRLKSQYVIILLKFSPNYKFVKIYYMCVQRYPVEKGEWMDTHKSDGHFRSPIVCTYKYIHTSACRRAKIE